MMRWFIFLVLLVGCSTMNTTRRISSSSEDKFPQIEKSKYNCNLRFSSLFGKSVDDSNPEFSSSKFVEVMPTIEGGPEKVEFFKIKDKPVYVYASAYPYLNGDIETTFYISIKEQEDEYGGSWQHLGYFKTSRHETSEPIKGVYYAFYSILNVDHPDSNLSNFRDIRLECKLL